MTCSGTLTDGLHNIGIYGTYFLVILPVIGDVLRCDFASTDRSRMSCNVFPRGCVDGNAYPAQLLNSFLGTSEHHPIRNRAIIRGSQTWNKGRKQHDEKRPPRRMPPFARLIVRRERYGYKPERRNSGKHHAPNGIGVEGGPRARVDATLDHHDEAHAVRDGDFRPKSPRQAGSAAFGPAAGARTSRARRGCHNRGIGGWNPPAGTGDFVAVGPMFTSLSTTRRPVLCGSRNRPDQPVKDSGPNRPHATKTAMAR